MRVLVASFLALLNTSYGLPAFARTWSVSLDGNGDASSIQAAIVLASAGDSIQVGPGTYHEAINFLGKLLQVSSTDGAATTVIDATGLNASVVTFASWEPVGTLLFGFTLTGGTGTPYLSTLDICGGAIFCTTGSPTIRKNVISGNVARFGGGIYIGRGDAIDLNIGMPMLEYNLVENNEATQNGGGIHVSSCYARVISNSINSNRARRDGGGIQAHMNTGHLTAESNTIRLNQAGDHGGGIYWFCEEIFGCQGASIRGNIIDQNLTLGEGPPAGDTGSGGGVYMTGGPATVANNTITRNRRLGPNSCPGGGIGINSTVAPTTIEFNIVAFNEGCGIHSDYSTVILGPNIAWGNGFAEWQTIPDFMPPNFADDLLVVDPVFCDLEGNQFAVSSASPALKGGTYGAIGQPQCDDVPIVRSTWSAIKSRF